MTSPIPPAKPPHPVHSAWVDRKEEAIASPVSNTVSNQREQALQKISKTLYTLYLNDNLNTNNCLKNIHSELPFLHMQDEQERDSLFSLIAISVSQDLVKAPIPRYISCLSIKTLLMRALRGESYSPTPSRECSVSRRQGGSQTDYRPLPPSPADPSGCCTIL